MKILLVSDYLDDWSLHTPLKEIMKYLPEYEFTIIAGMDIPLEEFEEFCKESDLIHINFTCNVTRLYEVIKKFYKKTIISVINERSVLEKKDIDYPKFLEMIQSCAYATALNKEIAGILNIERVPDGVDFDIFKRFKMPVVGYAGSREPHKLPDLIEKVCDDLGLRFRAAIYKEAQYPYEQMPDFYNGIDIYVMCSTSEGFGITIIEALACNLPVITTARGVAEELRDYVTIIEPTYESLKAALLKFCGRQTIQENFDYKNIAQIYKRIYEKVFKDYYGEI